MRKIHMFSLMLLCGVAAAGIFGVNGPAQGSDTIPAADGSGTFEIGWNGAEEILFTDPMKFFPNGGPEVPIGGDPGDPVVDHVVTPGSLHRFRIYRLANGGALLDYTFYPAWPSSEGATTVQRTYDANGNRTS